MAFAFRVVCALALVGCRDRHARIDAQPSPLETEIAHALTARFGVAVTVSCHFKLGEHCEGTLPDHTKVPLAIAVEKKEWTWHITGLVVDQKPLAEYIATALGDLHVEQTVECATVQIVRPGDRATCKLSGGGLAFVQFAADGTGTLELALDASAAAARGELVTPDRERELFKISSNLDGREGATDGEEEVTGDAGIEEPTADGGVAKP